MTTRSHYEVAVAMLIGAHVSPAGGPAKAVARGIERGANAIQIFNQNPRAWKPRDYSDEEVAQFRAAMADSPVDALLIHAVYLLNCATEDAEMRANTLRSLTASLQAGAALGAHAVVLHPGSAKTGDVGAAITRAGEVIAEALAESDGCALHLENTAGSGGTLGRSFGELAALIEAAGGDERLGLCLDSCHLLASGHEIRSAEALTAVLDDCVAQVGLRAAGIAAPQRLADAAGLQRRPPRERRRGRARQGRLCRLSLRAALSGPAARARDAGGQPQRPERGGDPVDAHAARARPRRAPRLSASFRSRAGGGAGRC